MRRARPCSRCRTAAGDSRSARRISSGMLDPARHAPGGEEVDHHRVALQRVQGQGLAVVQSGQVEPGAGLSIIADGSSWTSWPDRSARAKYPASTRNNSSGSRKIRRRMAYSPATATAPCHPAAGPRGDAHAPAPVAQADDAAERHDHAADPDPRNQRLPVGPDRPAALGVGIAQRDVKVGEQVGADRRHAGGLLLQREEAPLGMHDRRPARRHAVTRSWHHRRCSSDRARGRRSPASDDSRRWSSAADRQRSRCASCSNAEAEKPATETARPRCAKVMP